MTKFTAAVVQMNSGISLADNVNAMEAGIRAAAAAGATYIQTPEMTGLVQQHRKGFFAEIRDEDHDPVAPKAAELAKELGVAVHVGSTPIRLSDQMAANRAYVFGPDGRHLASYDKIAFPAMLSALPFAPLT